MTEPTKQLLDLEPDILKNILERAEKDAKDARSKSMAKREEELQDNYETPVMVDVRYRRTGLAARILGEYKYYGFEVFRNLDQIRERKEEIRLLQAHPLEVRARGMPPYLLPVAEDAVMQAEYQMMERGRLRTQEIQRQVLKDVHAANYLEHLLKKIAIK
jgi:hypothetical protein